MTARGKVPITVVNMSYLTELVAKLKSLTPKPQLVPVPVSDKAEKQEGVLG